MWSSEEMECSDEQTGTIKVESVYDSLASQKASGL
jgi:hypothetical protein